MIDILPELTAFRYVGELKKELPQRPNSNKLTFRIATNNCLYRIERKLWGWFWIPASCYLHNTFADAEHEYLMAWDQQGRRGNTVCITTTNWREFKTKG